MCYAVLCEHAVLHSRFTHKPGSLLEDIPDLGIDAGWLHEVFVSGEW
jgi:hypothetical protein